MIIRGYIRDPLSVRPSNSGFNEIRDPLSVRPSNSEFNEIRDPLSVRPSNSEFNEIRDPLSVRPVCSIEFNGETVTSTREASTGEVDKPKAKINELSILFPCVVIIKLHK